MTDDIEQLVRDDLLRRADALAPTSNPPVGGIISVSQRRTSRRTNAMTVCMVAILLVGLGALVATRSRESTSTATLPTVELCVSRSCTSAASAANGRVVVVTHDEVGAVTRVLTYEAGDWISVDANLPVDLVPAVVEVHAGRFWIGGSVPSPDDPAVRMPVVASAISVDEWDVQRLDWHGEPPTGFHLSASAEFLAFAGQTPHVLAPSAELVPDSTVYGEGATVCDVTTGDGVASIEFCGGEVVDVQVAPAVAEILEGRPLWGGSPAGNVAPLERAPQFLGWEVLSSNGTELMAVVQRPSITVVSTSRNGVEWVDTGRLVCRDGTPGRIDEPAAVRDGGDGILAGYCGDVVTTWRDAMTANPRPSAPIDGVATISAFVVDDAGLVLDIVDAAQAARRFVSTDGTAWSEVDDAVGRALAITSDQIIVASVDGLAAIDRPDR